MVKLIITDVDGVIVGHKVGVNFPYPSQKVIEALKEVKLSIPVVLCTGKYLVAPSVDKDGILKIFDYFLSF